MSLGIIIGIVIAVVAFGIIYAIFPEEMGNFFLSEPKPDVRFYDSPDLKEDKIKKGTATNIKVMARNFETEGVSNVEVHATIIEGSNWEKYLEFEPVIKIGDIKIEKGITDPKYIEIFVKDVAGVNPQYKIQLELFANGLSTGNTWEHWITLTE